MIIRSTPKDLSKYIQVDSNISMELHSNGFFPKYIDEDFIYYVKDKEILNFLERRNLNWK